MADHNCASDGPCPVPPHPDKLKSIPESRDTPLRRRVSIDEGATRPFGLNDGVLFPPPRPFEGSRRQAAEPQPPLRGPLNVLVVLTSFKKMAIRSGAAEYFRDLFFSKNKITTGSVTEYYEEVSGGLVSITGDIFGPYELPETASYYCQDGYGFLNKAANMAPDNPNTQTMAGHALDALLEDKPDIDLRPYDNQNRAKGTVDAFIVVHAGRGGEEKKGVPERDIWSIKWVLKERQFVGKSNTGVYGFLTLPDDARTGVSAHEIGHLVFQWPDLYGTNPERGVGNWCLMSRGSWNKIEGSMPGDVPCHPSAWLKAQQGWVEVRKAKGSLKVLLNEVKATAKGTKTLPAANPKGVGGVYRLWSNGDEFSNEFFLIENRMRYGFDRSLGGEGLLIWHVQDNRDAQNPNRFKLVLLNADYQATGMPVSHEKYKDGPGTPFPGVKGNRSFTAKSTPNSRAYNGEDTFVSLTNISDAGQTMRVDLNVQSAKANL
ncbi:peptidase, M6 family [Apodospora peruviana]|uniref:Peptidase, M6 family n=1 Tax=Apodospora peruviana TaxID=516989 RepID=A0AAE0M0U1_9PEZI|nr:peptidase, M6 family [Apodospora peruviana]